jgi:toluene monooxygenase system ferredoxin subunit
VPDIVAAAPQGVIAQQKANGTRQMAFEKICVLRDLSNGQPFGCVTADGTAVLVVAFAGGEVAAYQRTCPHAQADLAAGSIDGTILTCREHWWQFDLTSGQGVNPRNCHLAAYPVKVDGEDVLIDPENVTPFKAGR